MEIERDKILDPGRPNLSVKLGLARSATYLFCVSLFARPLCRYPYYNYVRTSTSRLYTT